MPGQIFNGKSGCRTPSRRTSNILSRDSTTFGTSCPKYTILPEFNRCEILEMALIVSSNFVADHFCLRNCVNVRVVRHLGYISLAVAEDMQHHRSLFLCVENAVLGRRECVLRSVICNNVVTLFSGSADARPHAQ